MNPTPSFSRFVGHVIDHCSREGVQVLFDPGPNVNGCMGLYQTGSLMVATGNPEWHLVLVHEYGHFLQDCDEKLGLYPGYNLTLDELDTWWKFVEKKRRPKNMVQIRQNVQRMERDCERRALGLIEQHALHDAIDKDSYVKKANSYLLFYTFLERVSGGGKWYKIPPYAMKAVTDMMPTTLFSDEELEFLPAKYTQLIKKLCM